jgi:tetratricopeptide (TPR) repeat protein
VCFRVAELASQNARPARQAQASAAATRDGIAVPESFSQGEAALQNGELDKAEAAFRQALAADPKLAGAYANLGVIYMRHKQWSVALENLHKAERLAPEIAGIRLNIGLAYFRQNDFSGAIAPFESVLREQPDSLQARYLLGLCYFFTDRFANATDTLEPLWSEENNQLNYLYVLGIAAGKAGRSELEQRALGRLIEVGQNSPELHLLMGKAHLNRQEYDKAIAELQSAAQENPTLPFVHFHLGMVYVRKQDYERAKAEFLKDIAIEPDVAYDYDELGSVNIMLQQYKEAETNFRRALHLDSHLLSSRIGLARIYQQQSKYQAALAQLDAAAKLNPNSYNVHYLRGQALMRLGRRREGETELAAATRMLNAGRAQRQKDLESGSLPDPDLTREPQ